VLTPAHRKRVNAVLFRIVLTASDDKTVQVWDSLSGKLLRVLSGHTHWVRGMALAPGGLMLATADRDRTARIWDAATGAGLGVLSGHTDWVRSAAFGGPDGHLLATASDDRTAALWLW
jgi:WD40 repeat protein